MDEEEKTIFGCLMGIIVAAWLFASVLLRGWMISVFWLWFVVPLGVTNINAAHGIGFSIGVALFKCDNKCVKEKDDSTLWVKLAKEIGTGLLQYAFAYWIGGMAHDHISM